nr:response regulator transcription factor [Desulfobulbaceae bacterium]
MPTTKKVVIIDDHDTFRESLKLIVGRMSDFAVVGEAADARKGEEAVRELKPDLTVVDLSLPDKSGIQLTRILKVIRPQNQIVIVSMHSKIDYILGALRAGAVSYLVKESVSRCLVNAFECAVKGEFYLDSALSQEVATKLLDCGLDTIANESYGDLTSREQEILRLLAQGITTKNIAERLFISPKTVTNHRANLMSKLQLHSTVDLVRYAANLGLLDTIS